MNRTYIVNSSFTCDIAVTCKRARLTNHSVIRRLSPVGLYQYYVLLGTDTVSPGPGPLFPPTSRPGPTVGTDWLVSLAQAIGKSPNTMPPWDRELGELDQDPQHAHLPSEFSVCAICARCFRLVHWFYQWVSFTPWFYQNIYALFCLFCCRICFEGEVSSDIL